MSRCQGLIWLARFRARLRQNHTLVQRLFTTVLVVSVLAIFAVSTAPPPLVLRGSAPWFHLSARSSARSSQHPVTPAKSVLKAQDQFALGSVRFVGHRSGTPAPSDLFRLACFAFPSSVRFSVAGCARSHLLPSLCTLQFES